MGQSDHWGIKKCSFLYWQNRQE